MNIAFVSCVLLIQFPYGGAPAVGTVQSKSER